MQRANDILVVTGNQIIPRKLESKLSPLLALSQVNRAYVVSVLAYVHPKVRSFYPNGPFCRNPIWVHGWKMLTVLAVLMRHDPAIVVTVGLIPHGIYTLLLATLFGRRKIYLSMGMKELIYDENGWVVRALRKIAFLSDAIGTRGSCSKEKLVGVGFPAERIFVSHNVFDFDDFRPCVCEKIYDLIYVGLLEPYKSVDFLLEAVRRLVFERGMKQIRLAIVGTGSLKGALRQQAQAFGISDHICFLPAGDKEHVCRLLNQSKVFVMTSQREGLPMAMIEAMSCGLPAVVFDHADIRDVARYGVNSLLCPERDLACFVTAVERLLKNPKELERLSERALEIRKKRKLYSVEANSDIWRKVMEMIMPIEGRV